MGAVTYYVAMPFVRSEDGDLVPGEAQERMSAAAAEQEAVRMPASAVGAVALPGRRFGYGEFEDAVVLRTFGSVPSLDDLLIVT